MIRNSHIFHLSTLWRPHSEQIKFWIAASATDQGVLPLARSYVHDLKLQSVVITLDDGVELVNVLQKIKYPQGSHAVTFLAKHFEVTSDELCAKDVRQLSADARLADADLTYYEATLGSPSFLVAFARCICSLDDVELVQLVTPFSDFAIQKGPHSAPVASRICYAVAEELSRRVNTSNDKCAMLTFIAGQSLPIGRQEWECLMKSAFAHTATLDVTALRTLLQSIATQNPPSRNSAWGEVVQEALVKSGGVAIADLCEVLVNAVRAGCRVNPAFLNLFIENLYHFSGEQVLSILVAWREVKYKNSTCSTFTLASQSRFEAFIASRVRQFPSKDVSREHFTWLYCLSFFSAEKSAGALKALFAGIGETIDVSPKDAALLSNTMIQADVFIPLVVRSVGLHAESDAFNQDESIAVLHVCQKAGTKAPHKLVKNAARRSVRRLVTTRAQESGANLALSSSSLAVLLAALSFVDDEEQLALLKWLLQTEPVAPAVAMAVLRFTGATKTKTCHFAKTKLIKKLIEAAETLSGEELSFTISAMAELHIRDVGAFERLLRVFRGKTVVISDVIAVGLAAKSLKLTPAFEQLVVEHSPHKLPGVTPAEIFTLLRCCGMERRRALLSEKEVRDSVDNVSVADTSTADLILLFIVSAANRERRSMVVDAIATRDPVPRHAVDIDDVLGAFECAASVQEIESICKVCANAVRDVSELHLMRLLRCAQSYPTIPNKFFRFAGKAILLLASQERLSPNNALLWTKLYVDHRVPDSAVGTCLVLRARRLRSHASVELSSSLQKASKLYRCKK